MKILTYRDLDSKDELLPLMDHAFRWPFNPRTFEWFVKSDPTKKDGPVGFCAVEDGIVIGFVGVLDLATRTLDGTAEYVGGIYGVATMPSHVRKGISTALMNSAHQHFRNKSYHFSFLGTSHTLIAHAFYEKLGYVDLLEIPSAYKVFKKKRAKSAVMEKSSKLDFDKILRIYNEFVKGKTGFVVRNEAVLRTLKKAEGLSSKQCIIEGDGYVLFRKDRNAIWIRELLASNAQEMYRLVGLVEEQAKDMIYDRAVLDNALLQIYRSRSYMIQERSHSVMMVKPLTADASFKQTYGDRFYLTGLDTF
jgi:GNAT superfamily N-acetyltransferase